MYAAKLTLITAFLSLPLLFTACSTEDNGAGDATQIHVTEDTNEVPPADFKLTLKSFDNGHYTVLVPEGFDEYITRQVFAKDSTLAVNTYKYRSTADSSSAVGISHGARDAAINRHLPKFMQKLEFEARQYQGLRGISSEMRMVNGEEFGILRYSLWRNGQEVDYAVVAASVIEDNMLTLNILFSGPVKPGYKETSNKIIESLTIQPKNQ